MVEFGTNNNRPERYNHWFVESVLYKPIDVCRLFCKSWKECQGKNKPLDCRERYVNAGRTFMKMMYKIANRSPNPLKSIFS